MMIMIWYFIDLIIINKLTLLREVYPWEVYPPDDPPRPCRPKAGQGLVMMMMMMMRMMMMTNLVEQGNPVLKKHFGRSLVSFQTHKPIKMPMNPVNPYKPIIYTSNLSKNFPNWQIFGKPLLTANISHCSWNRKNTVYTKEWREFPFPGIPVRISLIFSRLTLRNYCLFLVLVSKHEIDKKYSRSRLEKWDFHSNFWRSKKDILFQEILRN